MQRKGIERVARVGGLKVGQNVQSAGIVEDCLECGREQPHEVSIDLLTESDDAENASYSREPYRITECLGCGATSRMRMNDA